MPMNAAAQIAEVRVGVAKFDDRISPIPATQRADEQSVSISGEILFEEPKFLKWALSPQPYIGGSLNLEGNTSFGGAGLLWRQTVGEKFYGDFALGVVAHNGTRFVEPSDELSALLKRTNEFDNIEDIPQDILDGIRLGFDDLSDRRDNEIEFGSRVLFRLQGAIGVNVNEKWAGEIYMEHLSHGYGLVFGDEDVNDGVNILGIRAARKF